MAVKWALFFYLVPRSPDNSTKLDGRAKRVRDEIVRLARKYPNDLRVAYRIAYSGAEPAERVVVGKQADEDASMVEKDLFLPGDPALLPQFLRWAHKNGCVGKRCAVFFWGHGFGPAGLFSLEDLELFGAVALKAAPITVAVAGPKLPVTIASMLPQPAELAAAPPLSMYRPDSAPARTTSPLGLTEPMLRTAVPVDDAVQVTIGTRSATIRRADGLQMKLPPGALFRKDNKVFVYTPGRATAMAELPRQLQLPRTPIPQMFLMTTPSLESGLRSLRKLRRRPVDLVFFQSCWVSGLELARQLKDDARAMIGSQTLVPIQKDPWPYAQLIAKLRKAPNLNAPALRSLVRSLVRTLGTWHTQQKQRRPITGLNLKDKAATKAFHRVVEALQAGAGTPLQLEHLYSNAPKRDRKNGLYKTENTGLIDVLRLCADLESRNGNQALVSASRKLAKAVKTKLILGHHTPDKQRYRGVTVYYHPSQETIDRLNLPTYSDRPHVEWLLEPHYEELEFAQDSDWTSFAFENQL